MIDQFKQRPLVTIYDPINKLWESLPPIPAKFEFYSFSNCICDKHKLVLLGLYECIWPNLPTQMAKRRNLLKPSQTTRAILVFDFLSCKWRKGANMPTQQFVVYLACCASLEGLIYIALQSKMTSKVAVYNVEIDEWKLLPNMLQNQWLY
ncbi:hypothetical protein SUGI_0007320 [Cryptomeria japonica]|nr:hypothetical protein SUGI_0007320 [Cryptomeria japonica]